MTVWCSFSPGCKAQGCMETGRSTGRTEEPGASRWLPRQKGNTHSAQLTWPGWVIFPGTLHFPFVPNFREGGLCSVLRRRQIRHPRWGHRLHTLWKMDSPNSVVGIFIAGCLISFHTC